jgi:hypothetical protein
VAVGAEAPLGSRVVEVVLRRIVNVGAMALSAKRVPRRVKLRAVAIVAVAANDAGGVHLALKERPIDVNLVFDLSVIEVEDLVESCETVTVMIVLVLTTEIGASRMARRAQLWLIASRPRGENGDVALIGKRPLP